jgi:hypothetical protein
MLEQHQFGSGAEDPEGEDEEDAGTKCLDRTGFDAADG